jgi:hypothetical protein
MQKIRLVLRGWSRRRQDEAQRREAEFLQRNTAWAPPAKAAPASVRPLTKSAAIDIDGLQVAFLDDSGQIAHYLDVATGEVVEFRSTESHPEITGDPARYRRVPTRSDESEAGDRRAFLEALEDERIRQRLAASADGADFRRLLASDRTAERAWYNFKNDRALAIIHAWLREIGLE